MGWFDRIRGTQPAAEQSAPVRAEPRMYRGDAARHRQHAVRMFTAGAGGNDRLMSGWGASPMNADQIVERNQRPLVARSREQATNNDYAKAFLRMCRQNIVGPHGVQLQAQTTTDRGKLDDAANQALEGAFADWGNRENCDVTGKRSWRTIQAVCVNTAAKDGEFFVRMIYGADAGPWGFALQTIDPQRCPVEMNDDLGKDGRFIRQGIEFNRYGRPLAYYFSTTDEREADYRYGGKAYTRVPADEVLHGFLQDMEGQKRGLPWMATGLFRMRQLNQFEDSAAVNARVGANKMAFIQWKENYGPDMDEDDEIIIESQAGEFPILPAGAELKDWSPQYPANEFATQVKTMLRGISAGFGVPYNELAADLEGVNFSSIRQGTLDSREHWKDLQEWLVENLIQPVFAKWLEYSLLAGRIKAKGRPLRPERIDRYAAVSWQPRRWQWIDPRADVDAAVSSKNNMLASPGQIIREQGRDPQTVWKEAARDVRAMIDAYVAEGLPEKDATELVMLSMGKQPQKPAPGKQDGQATEKPAAE
ncbi:portal protein [Achromobacter phage Mano]|uniref:Portal protein n=1 Tax=Achromobacter phage Mano TaxID=2767570 RepID=A0A7L8G6A3_9CAUD|nr:portal protein [Achromobacter phage Mano]QOE32737.1 portal protein [Achromobacter phage Mano]